MFMNQLPEAFDFRPSFIFFEVQFLLELLEDLLLSIGHIPIG